MPTGYTSDIHAGKDVSLTDFAAGCARAFGAFIHQRDDSTRAALTYPSRPDNSYYKESLEKAKRELARWQSLSEEEKYAEWSDYFNERTVDLHKSIAKNSELRARYNAMLAQVHAVEVPSQLQNFKDFMVEQLTESIRFDCGDDDKFTKGWYQPQDYSTWADYNDEHVLRDVAYYEEELRKEQERYDERVSYINLMRDTFGFEVVDSEAD